MSLDFSMYGWEHTGRTYIFVARCIYDTGYVTLLRHERNAIGYQQVLVMTQKSYVGTSTSFVP